MKPIFPLAALGLAACVSAPPAQTGPTAGIGQVAYSNGVHFQPIRVIEDSRCPANVQCVWAGRLTVRTDISSAGWKQTRDLQLGMPQTVGQYHVVLTSAVPQKQAGAEIDSRAYRFTFAASGR